jgi:hypothetical protein
MIKKILLFLLIFNYGTVYAETVHKSPFLEDVFIVQDKNSEINKKLLLNDQNIQSLKKQIEELKNGNDKKKQQPIIEDPQEKRIKEEKLKKEKILLENDIKRNKLEEKKQWHIVGKVDNKILIKKNNHIKKVFNNYSINEYCTVKYPEIICENLFILPVND